MNEILPQTNSEATLQKTGVDQDTLRATLKEGFALIPLPRAFTQECCSLSCSIPVSPDPCNSSEQVQVFEVGHDLVSPYISNTSQVNSKDFNQTFVLAFPRCLWSSNTSLLPPSLDLQH